MNTLEKYKIDMKNLEDLPNQSKGLKYNLW